MVEVTGSAIYEELRRRGLLHLVRRQLEKHPINAMPRSDDEKKQALLDKVKKMRIKSVEELLRYQPLCKELQERGLLVEVMGYLAGSQATAKKAPSAKGGAQGKKHAGKKKRK